MSILAKVERSSASDDYAELGKIMTARCEELNQRKVRELLDQLEKEHPDWNKKRIKWEKSHK